MTTKKQGNGKGKSKGKGKRQRHGGGELKVYIPPFAMGLRKMGHPVFCGLRGWVILWYQLVSG
jgi:hypothetical protein